MKPATARAHRIARTTRYILPAGAGPTHGSAPTSVGMLLRARPRRGLRGVNGGADPRVRPASIRQSIDGEPLSGQNAIVERWVPGLDRGDAGLEQLRDGRERVAV